jgi:hypothetical protein
MMKSDENAQALTDTFTDPKDALEETKKALMLISKSFSKAKEGASKVNMFNEAEQKIKDNKDSDNKSI